MASPGVGGSLSAASDVLLDNPSNEQVLKRNNGYWKNLADENSGGVSSVNSKTGVVDLTADDVSAVPLASGGQDMRVVGYGTTLPATAQAGDVFFLQDA